MGTVKSRLNRARKRLAKELSLLGEQLKGDKHLNIGSCEDEV